MKLSPVPASKVDGAPVEKPSIAVVTPMANEKETAERFLTDLIGVFRGLAPYQIFVVFDKACQDGTFDIVSRLSEREPSIRVIWAPENTCMVDAYRCGYTAAIASGADWILEIDAGYSHQPSEIPKFIDAMRAGYDCVFGSRFCAGGKIVGFSFGRYMASKGGTVLTNFLMGSKLHDMTSGFQMFTREALESILRRGIISRWNFFQTEMKLHCRDMKTIELPITYRSTQSTVRQAPIADALKTLIIIFGRRLKGSR